MSQVLIFGHLLILYIYMCVYHIVDHYISHRLVVLKIMVGFTKYAEPWYLTPSKLGDDPF
jgi:hypothetical protein